MAPEAEATDVESARASTFKSGHTRLFTKYKGLFYIARIFRELVPAVLISFAMYGYVSSLWAARRGDSMIWHAMVPMRSSQLDKAAWHFALTKGETNPSCTAADLAKLPQPHEKVAHDLTVYDDSTKKGFNDCYWWQRVAEVVVYPRFGVEPGMRSWPAPKWQSGLGAGKAWSEGTDDLWCLAYKATSSVHVPYVRVNHTELGCGIAPEAVEEWANGWNTSYVLAEQAHFPSGDPGWEIILADNWPPSREGLCYSMCLDVAGVNEHTPAQQALDIAILFFLPVIIDLLLILVWLNQKTLYGGWVGTVSKKQRCTYLVTALLFWAGGITLIVKSTDANFRNQIATPPWPGAPVCALFLCLIGQFFCVLAIEDFFPLIKKRPMGRLITAVFYFLGLKDETVKDPVIDSDEALCFFLIDGYFSIFNWAKRYLTFVIFLFVLFIMTYVSSMVMWSEEYDRFNYGFFNPVTFMFGKVTVAILLIVKVNDDLTPPTIKIGYKTYSKRVAGERTWSDQVMNLLFSSAKDVTEREGLKLMTLFKSVESLEEAAASMLAQREEESAQAKTARNAAKDETSVLGKMKKALTSGTLELVPRRRSKALTSGVDAVEFNVTCAETTTSTATVEPKAGRKMTATFDAGQLGMGLGNRDGLVMVTSVDAGLSAEDQGVQVGSIVREVNGQLTNGLNKDEVINLIYSLRRPLTLTLEVYAASSSTTAASNKVAAEEVAEGSCEIIDVDSVISSVAASAIANVKAQLARDYAMSSDESKLHI